MAGLESHLHNVVAEMRSIGKAVDEKEARNEQTYTESERYPSPPASVDGAECDQGNIEQGDEGIVDLSGVPVQKTGQDRTDECKLKMASG